MRRSVWFNGLRTALGVTQQRKARGRRRSAVVPSRRKVATFEILEDRRLLAVDYGDAPDTALGTGVGNYNTLSTDDGPNHTIVAGIRMGATVDGDGGGLQNAAANADDVNGALPDDEDGLLNPSADLVLTIGAQPTLNLRVTNTTGASATLYGWIDVNGNGVFDNATERASVAVPNGTNNLIKTLTLPAVPTGFTGTTYARFRLSTDAAAANPTGAATDGEVEDYRVSITAPSSGLADSAKTKKIASGTNNGPTLANSDYFGRSMAAIGDIDGDGVTDLAVGAIGDDSGGSGRGAVHVLTMNSNGTVKTRQKINGDHENGDYFGSAVTPLGDLDGDGVVDLAIGLERSDFGGSNRGQVFVYFLNPNGTEKTHTHLNGSVEDGDYFGHSVATIGDLDGDGVTDLAIGAYGDNTGGTDRGALYVNFLNSNGTVKSSQKIANATGGGPVLANGDEFGSSVTSLGDLDGDGVRDLAVGAAFDDTGGTNRGAVHVLFMNSNGTVKSSQKIASGAGGGPTLVNGDQFGASMAALGDVDGDGVTDLAVGANYDDTGGTSRGAVHVLFMNANGTVKASHKIANGTGGGPTLANDDRFGVSVTSMGDLDGDGLTDIAVGANFDDTGGTNRGAVYTLFLTASPVNTNPFITSPNTANVPENTTAVMTVTATDADLPAQAITFSIVGGADQSRFSITTGGTLAFLAAPNFEAPTDANADNVYVVTVQASDGVGGTAEQTINVTITAVNDNNPVFTSANLANVPENNTAVMAVTATDADLPGQAITFSIVGGADQSSFSITSGGALSFASARNFEAPTDSNGDNVYVVTVQASDGNGGTAQQTINVTVTPVNEFAPIIISSNAVDVPENTTIFMLVTAFDEDLPAQTVTYSIVDGADQSKFGITSNGILSFLAPPDFEAPTDSNGNNVYIVTVQASDGNGGTATHTINVTVTPVNEFSPAFTSSNAANVPENTTTVMTVTATDVDLPAQTITFSIVGGADQAKFAITSGGALSFNTAPNFEVPTDANADNVYIVTVEANDNAGRTTSQTINVSVTNVGEPMPSDFGDAPDGSAGTGPGNYNTRGADNGPSHEIVPGLRLGATVDGDGGTLQNAGANADDVGGALPDDEDGLAHPAADLRLTLGAQPAVNVRVTNTTGAAATLYGWIDLNANGVFDNTTERASVAVPNGTTNGLVTLAFAAPSTFTGTTYARFRLSTDAAAANPTGFAAGGEVEDYRVTILRKSDGTADSAKTRKIANNLNGFPAGVLANGDKFGSAVASIGDLDGDGIADMAVGATSEFGSTRPGEVHVVFLNANGTVKGRQTIGSGIGGGPTLAAEDYFGHSLTALGDLDGDGVTDLAVGASKDNTGGDNRGAVHVLFMNANGTVKSSQKIASGVGGGPVLAAGDRFGNSVTSLGDLDGDGVADLAVGAVGDDTGGSYRGAVHVLLLNANGTVKSSQKIANSVGGGPILANGDLFGSSLASLGDMDGDGVSDLAVGAFSDDTGGNSRGAVHVLFMNSNGTVKNSQKIASGGGPILADGDSFGRSVASLGDLDGDGVTDLAVGAYQDDTGGSGRGALHVLLLNSNGTVKTAQKIAQAVGGGPTLANYDNFGSSVAALGDVDGDGVIDLAVGAERDDTGGNSRGAVYVLFLKAANTNPTFTSANTANVSENTTAVLTVTATDVDLPPQAVTFSIVGGADQARFGITAGGALSFNAAPNFEAPADANGDNIYVVTVQASDGAGGTAQQTINVTVTPVNEFSPVFTSTDSASVPENTTAVKTVTATDADLPAQAVTYSIVGGADQAKFAITTGGALSFSSAPNFEAPTDANGDNIYVVVVQASDGSLTEVQAILVTVTPVNDNNPVFTSTNTASVPENTTVVKTVTATDGDLPAQSVTFSIVGGADQSRFEITAGGALSFVAAPNFEAPSDANGDNIYAVTVQASDGAGGATTQTINVTVTPVNDNNPVITSTDAVSVPENATAVFTVTATDADLPPQAITFSIVGGADQAKFGITTGGVLTFNAAPDFETPTDSNGDNIYVVIVQASDGARTGIQAVLVTVTNVFEGLPGDYNLNNTVDAADYVVWRKTLGTNVTPFSGADGSGNGIVDQADHLVWMANFGRTQPGAGSVTIAAAETEPVASAPEPQVAPGAPEPVAQDLQTSIPLAEPETIVIWPSLPADAFVRGVKGREDVRHPRSGELPAAAGQQDEALVAWLESLPRGERSEPGTANLDDWPSEFDPVGFQAGDDTDGSLDLAFALFDSAEL